MDDKFTAPVRIQMTILYLVNITNSFLPKALDCQNHKISAFFMVLQCISNTEETTAKLVSYHEI